MHEANLVADGPGGGRTLAEQVATHGADLLGRRVARRSGARFPLLIKLLDTSDWLSLQVHPNDEQARRLEGPEHLGKTEAWHFLVAEPGARVIFGLRPGVERPTLEAAIRGGTILDLVNQIPVRGGDTLLTPAGTIHALGPGLLLYEVQQTSDITYRVFDWNRPLTAGRALHIEQSLAVVDPGAGGQVLPAPSVGDGGRATVVACPFFTLDLIAAERSTVTLDTGGESFHAVTVTEGGVMVEGAGWSQSLDRLETVIVPAACGAYTIRPLGPARLLKASAE